MIRWYTDRTCSRCGTPFEVKLSRNVERVPGVVRVRWLPVHDRLWCDECNGRVKR